MILFNTLFKLYNLEGNLAWEYNPLRNYRLSKDILAEDKSTILYKKGLLVDFETDELLFDVNHPVDILPLYSYDGSVNLIINDGKNIPRLINTRFSPIGRDRYLIVDRKGDNDANIYDLGDLFDIDTSLYKRTNTIPELNFLGTTSCGNLSIGNYNFYFKYMDADGNETDFILESGLVSIFIGDEPYNINSGFRNLNSYKGVRFILTELDSAYLYISVYYTRNTSDIYENPTTLAFKIEQKYIINNANNCSILITGFENTTELPIEDINLSYLVAGSVFTLTSCLNRLFLANIEKPKIEYIELLDIALRFYPKFCTEPYKIGEKINLDYEIKSDYKNSYYNPQFIYDKTGYWPGEMYRFGVVFIMSDNTLTPVFNTRGAMLDDKLGFLNIPYKKITEDGKIERVYVSYDEETNLLVDYLGTSLSLENAKGVVHIPEKSESEFSIYGILFELLSTDLVLGKDYGNLLVNLIEELKKLGVKGYFFVRLKRIPTTLCLAYTINIDKESHTPLVTYKDRTESISIAESFLTKYIKTAEILGKSIEDKSKSRLIDHDFESRLIDCSKDLFDYGAICPEYDINSSYYNTLFNGDSFTILRTPVQISLEQDPYNKRHFRYKIDSELTMLSGKVRILAIEDNTKLSAIGDTFFSARAGEAEEAFRFEYVGYLNNNTNASNLLRGSFGPFLGITDLRFINSLINIKIPNYNSADMQEYFSIRYLDKSPYFAIGDRKPIELLSDDNTYFRGDCFICQFTHRMNRNFLDPSAPTNDKIVDKYCWANNYEVTDGVMNKEKFDNINLGDVNAVKLGMWVTIPVRSSINLNIRSLDDSIPDETALTGHPRSFFPYSAMSTEGVYKVPEALCHNSGLSKLTSERYNFEIPDVPYLKNEFSNRILYSDILVTDAFLNNFRVFKGSNYRDYPKTYGSITKLIELRGNLLCIFEHGIGLIPVNERTVAGEGSGGNVYINTSNVLPENPKIISDTFGSQWRDSIIKTPKGVYGVDTIGKKIWRTNGEDFECISDFRIQEFLNQNISLTEREIEPVIGIRNVKTHYNKFKLDVMFTFYDNLYGIEEKAWNICFNESILKWITFYSWIPSYSENIHNLFFSFDRNTSKYISKLGSSTTGSSFAGNITVDNVVIANSEYSGILHLDEKFLPKKDNVKYNVDYEIMRDNYKNYDLFEIVIKDGEKKLLKIKLNKYSDIINSKNSSCIVIYLNIKACINASYNNEDSIEIGTYELTIAIIPSDNLHLLTTDFWKHGLAGIIDNADLIKPTHWYGKLHPFEFEFVVADNPDRHKIFDSLEIISNKAAPESFHYEIVGECYDFAKDKKNMYIRLEATKELYQFNGSDIVFDPNYKKLISEHRPLTIGDPDPLHYDKSTIFPLYYSRQDTINEIEDSYHLYGHKDHYGKSDKNFSALAGAEIVRYENLDEYRIWNHAKAVDIKENGLLRGNMYYKEDKWYAQINPINLVQKNETREEWDNIYRTSNETLQYIVPAECNLFPPPADIYNRNDKSKEITLPLDWTRNVVSWSDYLKRNREAKIKDKFVKIRIRYSGKDLAIISAIRTLYSISYA